MAQLGTRTKPGLSEHVHLHPQLPRISYYDPYTTSTHDQCDMMNEMYFYKGSLITFYNGNKLVGVLITRIILFTKYVNF